MSVHREQSSFLVRLVLSAEFDEDYDGEDDGYAWLEAWRARVQPRLLAAIFRELRAQPGFFALPVSRGQSPDAEAEIAVRFDPTSLPPR